jgi:uridylate kinase
MKWVKVLKKRKLISPQKSRLRSNNPHKKALSAFFYASKKRFHAGISFKLIFSYVREVRAVNTLNDRKYKRVLIKLSGEALQGEGDFGIDPRVLDRMALEIGQLVGIGVQVGLVIGGGNLFRGAELSEAGLDRVTGDHMGMLATTMNALAMRDALERSNIPTTAMSAIPMSGVVDRYDRRSAIRCLEQGDVVIFSAGTGNPFFTTDSAAALRAIETDAELMIKATKVDGVYDADPMENASAVKFDTLTYDEVLDRKLAVMDLTAICLCRDHNMPVRVFEMEKTGALVNIVVGVNEGTLIQ